MKKKILVSILSIGVLVGMFFFVKFQILMYNTVVIQKNRVDVLDSFLTRTFPTQVQGYLQDIKALEQKK